MGKADTNLIAISDAWLAVELRVTAGRAYVAAHPSDVAANSLLVNLERQAEKLEHKYYAANATYKALADMENQP